MVFGKAVLHVPGMEGDWYPVGSSNLVLFYKRDVGLFQDAARTTPAAVGEAVGGIEDQSGVGNHASSALTQRPTRQSGYLDMDGSNDKLSTLLALGQAFTIYLAVKMNSFRANATLTDCLLSTYAGAGAFNAGEIIVDVYGLTKAWRFRWSGRTAVEGGTPDTANHVITLVGSTTANAIYVDNTLVDSDTHVLTSTSANLLQIGEDITDPGGLTSYPDMNLGGMLVYSVAHTPAEMVHPYNYLAAGWTT